METFATIVEVVAVAFWSLALVLLLGLIAAHWRAEFRAPQNGDEHSSLRPNRLLLERRIGDLHVVVTWKSGTSFVGSVICYEVRWSPEEPSLTLVRNPPLDVSTAMTMPVTSRWHPEFGTAIPTRIPRLRAVDTAPGVLEAWLTSEREAAIAHLLSGPFGPTGSTIRLECSDVALQLSVPERADGRVDRTKIIDWLLGAVDVLRISPGFSRPVADQASDHMGAGTRQAVHE